MPTGLKKLTGCAHNYIRVPREIGFRCSYCNHHVADREIAAMGYGQFDPMIEDYDDDRNADFEQTEGIERLRRVMRRDDAFRHLVPSDLRVAVSEYDTLRNVAADVSKAFAATTFATDGGVTDAITTLDAALEASCPAPRK